MKIDDNYDLYYDMREHAKIGDEIWACAHDSPIYYATKRKHQPPVLGILTAGNTEESNNMRIKSEPNPRIEYFVPYKNKSKEPNWKKAVGIYNRTYATTYDESVAIYNQKVQEYIDELSAWYIEEIDKSKKLLI